MSCRLHGYAPCPFTNRGDCDAHNHPLGAHVFDPTFTERVRCAVLVLDMAQTLDITDLVARAVSSWLVAAAKDILAGPK